ELARGWATVAGLVTSQAGAAWMLSRFGPRDARARHVPAMTRGERWGCLVLDDSVRARAQGAGWMLSGVAPLVETASRADLFVVSARTGDDRAACFLVERDAHRLGLSEVSETVGGRGLGSCDVIFDGVEASARLEDGAGASAAQLARIGAAAIGVGVAQAAF